MCILIISDIHANLNALNAVISDAKEYDEVWCLGDLVGYGPDPNECVETISQFPNLNCILGNHDAAVINNLDKSTFNNEAKIAIEWTQKILTDDCKNFLLSLPEIKEIDLVTLAHGSPQYPIWEYILDIQTAARNFHHFSTTYCFVGHTHFPVVYHQMDNRSLPTLSIPEPGISFTLPIRSIINPGSVGQPRDRDPRASYAIYQPDHQTWEYRRVIYNIKGVQERMIKAQLPEKHILRLNDGW